MTSQDFIDQFEDCSLPVENWTHAGHIHTALWYVHHHGLDAALCFLRSGIIRYNASVGGENTPTGGYHETLTIFWAEAVARFDEGLDQDLSFGERWEAAQKSHLMDKELAFQSYSKAHLMSTKARGRWVEPDL